MRSMAQRVGGSLVMALSMALLMTPLAAPPLAEPVVRAQGPAPISRGELLYRNHCIACHSTSVHWRDRRLVTDFGSLVAQVGRWEKNGGLGWSSEEILDVVGYLNATIYRFPNEAGRRAGNAPALPRAREAG